MPLETIVLIRDHLWRPPPKNGTNRSQDQWDIRPCEYMNCRRPREEHERAVTGRPGPRWSE